MNATAISDVTTPENVNFNGSAMSKRQALSRVPKLSRITFRTCREMDFFSEKELVTQTGHEIGEWPLVIVKELVDNGLDACEDADIAPVFDVMADAGGIAVRDNGPGLPETTLKDAMDFTVRTSNREAYVSPTRGAQGNALKTLLPMPWVINPKNGRMIITAQGKKHVIRCGADPISQRAVIHDDVSTNVKNNGFAKPKKASFNSGTEVRIEWLAEEEDGAVLWPFDNVDVLEKSTSYSTSLAERFRGLVEGFAVFNPHATITLDWFGERTIWKATDSYWEKWKPNQPTSSHWYELRHLERLIGAYLTHDRDNGADRLISDFVAQFDGFSGSQKRSKVLHETSMIRMQLAELVLGDRLDSKRIAGLLAAMQKHARPVKSQRLGIIGEDHFKQRLLAMGVKPESFRYSRKVANPKCKKSQTNQDDKASFLPWILEAAFGYLGEESGQRRLIFSGANWSAAINNPFRSFGGTGEGLETALADMRVTREEPVVYVLHLAHPRIEFTDRGKTALLIE